MNTLHNIGELIIKALIISCLFIILLIEIEFYYDATKTGERAGKFVQGFEKVKK